MAATVLDMSEIPEARLARLESDAAHIQSDVTDIKIDLRQFRSEMHGEFKAVRSEMQEGFRAVRTEISGLRTEVSNRIWALAGLIVTVFLAMWGMMARGFGWIH
jgi:hypothetical protein